MKFKLKRIWLLLVLIVILGVIIFLIYQSTEATKELPPDEAIEQVTIRDVEKIVSVDGNVSGAEEYKVFAPSQARIVNIEVEVGEKVNNNQLLATIEVQSITGTASEELRAPASGTITKISYKEGETVFSPTVELMKIVDTRSLIVTTYVNENDILDLKTNQQVTLTLPAISFEEQFEGTVSFISPTSIENSPVISYLVEIEPENLPKKIKLGMSVSAEILIQREEDVLTVPESFLVEKNDSYFVKVLEFTNTEESDYTITDVAVRVGLITDEFVEIQSGVEEGVTIVEPSFTITRDNFSLFF